MLPGSTTTESNGVSPPGAHAPWIRGEDISLSVIRIGVMIYLPAMFLPHTGFIQTLALYVPFLFWLWRRLTGREGFEALRQPVMGWLLLWVVSLLPFVFIGPDLAYSLGNFHKTALRALILALLVVEGFHDPAWFRRLLAWLALMGTGVVVLFSGAIVRDIAVHDGFQGFVSSGRYRGFGDALVILLPLVYLQARIRHGHAATGFFLATLALAALAVITGSRGIALAAVAPLIVLAFYNRHRVAMAGVVAAIIAGVLVFSAVFKAEVASNRMASGLYDSVRMQEIWKPSVGIWLERAPWQGFGYGLSNFERHYDDAVSTAELQHRQGRYGLHNQLLSVAVQAGLIGVLSTLLLAVAQVITQLATLRRLTDPDARLVVAAILAALIAHYGLRGLIDTVSWVPMGLILGLAACAHTALGAGRNDLAAAPADGR
ncbi:MAG: O-antigen ligase family protein [Gammaproteobacteria bacterium]